MWRDQDTSGVIAILVLVVILAAMVIYRRQREAAERAQDKALGLPAAIRRPQPSILLGMVGFVVLVIAAGAAVVTPVLWLALLLGLIPAAIAQGRGSPNFVGWWAFGTTLLIIALPAALMRRDDRRDQEIRSLAGMVRQTSIAARRGPTAPVEETGPREGMPASANGVYPSWVEGLQHRDAETRRIVAACFPGDDLVLEREPGNAYDPSAVRISWRGTWLGYVPARHAHWVAEIMDAGRPMRARIADTENVDGEVRQIATILITRP